MKLTELGKQLRDDQDLQRAFATNAQIRLPKNIFDAMATIVSKSDPRKYFRGILVDLGKREIVVCDCHVLVVVPIEPEWVLTKKEPPPKFMISPSAVRRVQRPTDGEYMLCDKMDDICVAAIIARFPPRDMAGYALDRMKEDTLNIEGAFLDYEPVLNRHGSVAEGSADAAVSRKRLTKAETLARAFDGKIIWKGQQKYKPHDAKEDTKDNTLCGIVEGYPRNIEIRLACQIIDIGDEEVYPFKREHAYDEISQEAHERSDFDLSR